MRSDFSKKKKKVSDDVLRRAGIFTAVFLCCLLLFGGVAVYVVLRAGDERDDLSLNREEFPLPLCRRKPFSQPASGRIRLRGI